MRATRKDGKRPVRGDRVTLYSGLRTKSCRKLGEGVVTACWPVQMDLEGVGDLVVENAPLSWIEREPFARADGFFGWADMRDWFRGPRNIVTTFDGFVVKWRTVNSRPSQLRP